MLCLRKAVKGMNQTLHINFVSLHLSHPQPKDNADSYIEILVCILKYGDEILIRAPH